MGHAKGCEAEKNRFTDDVNFPIFVFRSWSYQTLFFFVFQFLLLSLSVCNKWKKIYLLWNCQAKQQKWKSYAFTKKKSLVGSTQLQFWSKNKKQTNKCPKFIHQEWMQKSFFRKIIFDILFILSKYFVISFPFSVEWFQIEMIQVFDTWIWEKD